MEQEMTPWVTESRRRRDAAIDAYAAAARLAPSGDTEVRVIAEAVDMDEGFARTFVETGRAAAPSSFEQYPDALQNFRLHLEEEAWPVAEDSLAHCVERADARTVHTPEAERCRRALAEGRRLHAERASAIEAIADKYTYRPPPLPPGPTRPSPAEPWSETTRPAPCVFARGASPPRPRGCTATRSPTVPSRRSSTGARFGSRASSSPRSRTDVFGWSYRTLYAELHGSRRSRAPSHFRGASTSFRATSGSTRAYARAPTARDPTGRPCPSPPSPTISFSPLARGPPRSSSRATNCTSRVGPESSYDRNATWHAFSDDRWTALFDAPDGRREVARVRKLSARETGRAGAFTHVVAEGEPVSIDGWVRSSDFDDRGGGIIGLIDDNTVGVAYRAVRGVDAAVRLRPDATTPAAMVLAAGADVRRREGGPGLLRGRRTQPAESDDRDARLLHRSRVARTCAAVNESSPYHPASRAGLGGWWKGFRHVEGAEIPLVGPAPARPS